MKTSAAGNDPAKKLPPTPRPGGSWLGRHWALAMLAMAVLAGAGAWGAWRYIHRSPAAIEGVRHVVLISIDTCRADRLSCYGYKRPTTPNIDAVAREGVLFLNAFTPVPITTPAHSSMFTGTYPPVHGVRRNGARLGEANVTLARILRDAGYQTGAFVGGFPLDAQFGLNQGFDTYDCRFARPPGQSSNPTRRSAQEVNRSAMAWVEANARKPFFLFLHYYDAHDPYDPPPYASEFANDLYAGGIAYVDHCIGQVMDRLRALGLYDDTLVIITGDHGESLEEHGEKTHGYFMYQSALHVPLVIRLPKARDGRRVGEYVSLVDIMPTVLDLAGSKTPPQVQGASLRGSLEGRSAPNRGGPIYAESMGPTQYGPGPLNGIVDGPWKYIRAPKQELYDLKGDWAEQNNLIEREPAAARRLRSSLEAALQEMEGGDRRGGSSAPDAEAMKKLQGLGYVAGAQDQATSAFDPTLEDPKDFLPTYRRLVRASGLLASQPEEAAAELQEIVKSRPELLAAHMLLFQKALTDHRTADARQLLDRIATLRAATGDASKRLPGATWKDVAVPLCHTELGQALMAEGKMPEAAVEFENALRLDPSLRDTRYYLALARQRQGKLDEAIAQYRKALQIDPGFANAWNNLGAALREQNKPQEAADCFAKALEADPDHADAHYNLAAFLQQTGKLPEAIEHYEQALRINPDLAKTTNVTAALAGARKAVAAIERCRQALRARPDDPEARNNLGAELSQCGQTAQAIEQFEQALRARPDYAEAHYNLALARERTGEIREAIAHYTQALQRKGDLLPALNNLAWLLATQNDPSLRNGPEAVRLAERACQLTGRKQGALLDTLAAAYAQAGQFPDAIAAAQEALALVQAANQPAAAADIQLRLSGYRAGHAFRQGPEDPTTRPARP